MLNRFWRCGFELRQKGGGVLSYEYVEFIIEAPHPFFVGAIIRLNFLATPYIRRMRRRRARLSRLLRLRSCLCEGVGLWSSCEDCGEREGCGEEQGSWQ